MISVGMLLVLLGGAIGMRGRIVALGFVVGIASVIALLTSLLSGSSFWSSAGWAAYTGAMLQLGYVSTSFVAARFLNSRKPAATPACGQH